MLMQNKVVVFVKQLPQLTFIQKECDEFSNMFKTNLNESDISVSRQTIICCLVEEFGLKSRKPARKPRLTLKIEKKNLQFTLQHKDWTCAQWSKALFSDKFTVQQFAARNRNVC